MLKTIVTLCLLYASQATLAAVPTAADGSHDFDWELGRWKTDVQVRAPLSKDAPWAHFSGTSQVRGLSADRANTVELDIANTEGRRIEGISLRLFNPETGQWNINYAGMRDGSLTPPLYGSFTDGRGEFYGLDTVDGRPVYIRFIITVESKTRARFVQAYSADGGKSWTDNWIAVDTRIED